MPVTEFGHGMDSLDREILNEIQWTFPLTARPFDVIAEKFGITPPAVKERLTEAEKVRRPAPAQRNL